MESFYAKHFAHRRIKCYRIATFTDTFTPNNDGFTQESSANGLRIHIELIDIYKTRQICPPDRTNGIFLRQLRVKTYWKKSKSCTRETLPLFSILVTIEFENLNHGIVVLRFWPILTNFNRYFCNLVIAGPEIRKYSRHAFKPTTLILLCISFLVKVTSKF